MGEELQERGDLQFEGLNSTLKPAQAKSQSCITCCIAPVLLLLLVLTLTVHRLQPYHSPALSHSGITTPLSHLPQPATAGRLTLLQATLLITYSLSVTLHLCLWSKSQLMERGKVKRSNNGDSCFSLFEKIHFVLLSSRSSPPSNPPTSA